MRDDFESGSLDAWKQVSSEDLSIATSGGLNGSAGAAVSINSGSSYLSRTDLAQAEEAYLTFWFNPNGASIPDNTSVGITSKSFRIASIRGTSAWHRLVGLRIRKPSGQGYKAYLEWNSESGTRYDYLSGEFSLTDGWQKITLGYRVDDWVAVWVNDVLMRQIDGVTHDEPYGSIIEIGKTDSTSSINPSGSIRFDEVALQIPRISDLWVDAVNGSDANNGLSSSSALATIQKAASLASAGTTVHIMPGIYREEITPSGSGTDDEPITYVAENGPGTVKLWGSEPASGFVWHQLASNTIGLPSGVDPANIYYADLSAWGLDEPPRFVVQLDANDEVVARLPVAREPDWHVESEWKYHEFWWAADGGSSAATCDPSTNSDPQCDASTRSMTQLTDKTNDTEPAGIESGNLTTLGNLTGATLVAMDTRHAHYSYRRTIIAHDVSAGRITIDEPAEMDFGSGEPGLGWGSKYYVENHPALLDTPGEWWFDTDTGYLYLWPTMSGNPANMNIEISRLDTAFDMENRSYITLDGLTVEFFNGVAYSIDNWTDSKAYGNALKNMTIRYTNEGVVLSQRTSQHSSTENIIDGFVLENSEIGYMDTYALLFSSWWEDNANPEEWSRSGIVNTVVRNNELHHLGFRSDKNGPVGSAVWFPDKFTFEGNHVHHVAHNGLVLHRSVIQAWTSGKEYGFYPGEIKTGDILIQDNIFEKACQIGADCGALKFSGSDRPNTHVFRDVLITGNIVRDTFGWSWAAEKRGDVSPSGMAGHGMYFDRCSGFHIYRNIAYNTSGSGFKISGLWRDGEIIAYNNIAANSLFGFKMDDRENDDHDGSVNTKLVNNIMVNNQGYGLLLGSDDGNYGNLTIDNNLYYGNGWDDEAVWDPGQMGVYVGWGSKTSYHNLSEIQAGTPFEDHGAEGNPYFWSYSLSDTDPFDDSQPDFHPTADSTKLMEKGTTTLPASLQTLIDDFGVKDHYWGDAIDIGRYEVGFILVPVQTSLFVNPGGSAQYTLQLFPSDLPYEVTLDADSPSSDLIVELSPSTISADSVAVLTVTDTHDQSETVPASWLTIPVTGSGNGITQTTEVALLVGGTRVFLPMVVTGQ